MSPKKVTQVKQWLLDFYSSTQGTPSTSTRVLLLTGPTGSGKSATVQVLCRELGLKVLAWNAPTPTLWHEHAYHDNLATEYVSKLRAFDNFLRRSTMLCSIPTTAAMGSGSGSGSGSGADRSKEVILIDDMPTTHNHDQHANLLAILNRYARSSRFPILICLSNMHRIEERDTQTYMQDKLVRNLEENGAATISFPSLTTLRIVKVLQRVSKEEGMVVDKSVLTNLAEGSHGDIRNAITSLQFSLVGVQAQQSKNSGGGSCSAAKRKRGGGRKGKEAGGSKKQIKVVVNQGEMAKDRELQMFHALGKVLYNKRTEDNVPENNVEDIVTQSHLDARSLLCYLHENFLHFVDEEAMDEVADILEYFSDAAHLLERDSFCDNLGVNYASLISVMGFQYANVSKAPRSYYQMRKPAFFEVQRSMQLNRRNRSKQVPFQQPARATHGIVNQREAAQVDSSEDEIEEV